MGESLISVVPESCRLGGKSKAVDCLGGCAGAMCIAQRLEVASMGRWDEGSLFVTCHPV